MSVTRSLSFNGHRNSLNCWDGAWDLPGTHDLFLLEDLAVVIVDNAIIPPILISTFKIAL